MQYVYKYLNNRGDVVYVGITNNMARRVKEHKSDKLADIKNPMIYYFPVKHRGDAEMLETYLIGWYGTKKYYNTAKTRKGDFSFLDVVEDFPWQRYEEDGAIEKIPFVISEVIGTKEVIVEKEKIVKEKVYVDKESSANDIINRHNQKCFEYTSFLDDQISSAEDWIKHLLGLLKSKNSHLLRLTISCDLILFDKRLRALRLQRKYANYALLPKALHLDDNDYNLGISKFMKAKRIADTVLERLCSTGRVEKECIQL